MANTVKVGITADVNGLVQGAQKGKQAIEQLGNESKKTSKNIKTISGAANAEKRIINELALQYYKLTDAEKKAFGSEIQSQMNAHIAKMKEIKAVQNDINNQINGVSNSFGKLGSTIGQVGSNMGLPIGNLTALLNPTTAAIAGVAALGAAFVKTAKDTEKFNSELNNLSTRLGVDKSQLKMFGDEAIKLGNQFALSGTEIVKQFNNISQQLPGIEKDRQALFGVAEAANKLAIGMGTDMEQSTSALVTVLSKFNLSGREATSVANAMAEASRNTGASLEYQTTVFEKVGSAAKAIKIPYTDIAAATGVLSSSFADASQVGAGLTAMINKLGKQKDEFNPAVVGLQQAVKNMADANLTYADVAGMVGPKAAQVTKVLIDQQQAFNDLAESTKNSEAAEEMFGIKSEELGFIINKVKTMWENFLLKIGESQVFQTIMGVIKDIITWIEELSTEIQAFFDNSSDGSGFAQMWNIIREAIAAVLPILSAVIKAYLVLQDTIMKVVSFIVNAIVEFVQMVAECFQSIYDGAVEIWNEISDFISGIWHSLVDPVVDFVNEVSDWFSQLWNNIKATCSSIWDSIVSTFKSVTKPIMDVVNKIIGFFKGLWDNIKAIFDSIYKKISDTAVFKAIVKVYQWFKDKITALIKIVQDAWNAFLDAIGLGGGKSFVPKSDNVGDAPPTGGTTPTNTPDPNVNNVSDNGNGGGSSKKGGGSKKGGSSKKGGGSEKNEPDAGTVEWYNKEIQKRQKMLKEEKHSDDEIKRINAEIADLTEKRNAEQKRINVEKSKELVTIEDYDNKISELNDKLKKQNLTDKDRADTLRELVDLETKKKRLEDTQSREKAVIELEGRVSPETFKMLKDKFGDRLPFYIDLFKDAKTDKEIKEIADKYNNVLGQIMKVPELPKEGLHAKTLNESKREKYDNGISALNRLQDDYNIGIIPDEETFLNKWNAIKSALEADGLTVEIEPKIKENQMQKTLDSAADTMGQLGDAIGAIASASEDEGLNAAAVIAQAIANIWLGFSKALAADKTTKSNIWAFIGAALGGVASIVGVVSAINSNKYAEGGIIQGSSTMGDHLIARVNAGEAILNQRQQARLFDMIDHGQMYGDEGGSVQTFRIRGEDLYVTLNNYGKIHRKTTFGRGINSGTK